MEGSLARLAPDCQTGQIEFANLAEIWFRQSGNALCYPWQSGSSTSCSQIDFHHLGFAVVTNQVDLGGHAQLRQLTDCAIEAFARLV